MWNHWNQSNTNFQQRITETTDAHNKLQSHLSKTMQVAVHSQHNLIR